MSLAVVGIQKAALENDLETLKGLIEAGQSVNSKDELTGLTLLHLAILGNSVEVLEYLLSRDDIEIDAKSIAGQTPLRTACGMGAYSLLNNTTTSHPNVNTPDNVYYSPPHTSEQFPKICQLLIEKGANIDATDRDGATPLHSTIPPHNLDTMYMLLYHNADPNVPDTEALTPFMYAVIAGWIEAQRALLDYVVDFNATHFCKGYTGSLLGLALQYGSPFVAEIIERGADVNYGDRPMSRNRYDDCVFMDYLYGMNGDETVFKMVWERLRCYRKRKPIDLCKLFSVLSGNSLASVVQVIVESDNLELAVDSFTRNGNFHLFACDFVKSGLDVEQIIILTYRFLEYGYHPTLDDVRVVFSHYGSCELTRVLRYIDVDCKGVYRPESKTYLRAMFDLDFDAVVLAGKIDCGECRLTRKELVSVLGYFRDPYLMDVLQSKFGESEIVREVLDGVSKVPSLVELARNQARKHFREFYKITSMCQFYTIMDYLGVPSIYVSILTYGWKIYRDEQ